MTYKFAFFHKHTYIHTHIYMEIKKKISGLRSKSHSYHLDTDKNLNLIKTATKCEIFGN